MTAHLTDPTPLISKEQAEADRLAFVSSAEEWRKKNNRERTRKAAAKKLDFEREQKIAQAKGMRSSGMSWRELDVAFGVSRNTVRCWIDDEFAEARRAAKRSSAKQYRHTKARAA